MFPSCLYRKAVKATLVLLPLLGITYMLFFVNPGEDDISQIVFIYFNSFLQSFQVRRRVKLQRAVKHAPACVAFFHACIRLDVAALWARSRLDLKLSCGRMIWRSSLAVLSHMRSPLPHAPCSLLSRWTGSCGHEFCFVANLSFFFFFLR